MRRLVCTLVVVFWMGAGLAAGAPDSKQLEADLQSLPWKQFRSVVEAVPNLKAEVEQYGTAGWAYVKAKYKTHAWKKSIDKLSAEQKSRLAELIEKARAGK